MMRKESESNISKPSQEKKLEEKKAWRGGGMS